MLVAQSKTFVETVRKFSPYEIQQNEKNAPFFWVAAIFSNSSAKNSKQKKAPPTTTLTTQKAKHKNYGHFLQSHVTMKKVYQSFRGS